MKAKLICNEKVSEGGYIQEQVVTVFTDFITDRDEVFRNEG